MSRQSAFIDALRALKDPQPVADLHRSVDALIEEVETGGLPYGEYSGDTAPDPAPPPAPSPDPAPPPDPDPAPPPAVPNDPATSWRDAVEALRDRTFTTAAPSSSDIYVGKGKTITLDGLNHVANASSNRFVINIANGGTIQALRNFHLVGPYGAAGTGAKCVIKQTPNGDLSGAGAILLVEDGKLIGWPDDVIQFRGVPGVEQIMRRVYIGPQYPRPDGKPHCDQNVFPALLGDVLIEECLYDHIEAGLPGGGDNNVWRAVPNDGTDPQGDHSIRIRRTVVHGDDYRSKLMQIAHKQNYKPRVDFQDVFLPASRIDPSDLYYPGSPIYRWVNVRDTYTGELIPPPPGALTV